jgi:ubiquinol-cytochrome c reductase cytochrome b subunit
LQNLFEEPNNSDVVQQILLNARTSPIEVLGYVCDSNMYVKTPKSGGQPAGVREISTLKASQRLNAKDLSVVYAYLVGLIEGDGYFTVTKKGKYFQCELGIELNIRDVQLIYKIKELLGVGVVGFRERKGINMVYLRIRKKDHLINKVLPIFDKYPLFSNKQYDYLNLKNVLLSDVVYYEELADYTRPKDPLNSIETIISAPYFSA